MNKKWKKFVTASLIFALLLSNAIGTTILPNDSRNIVVSAASDEETVSDKYKELYAQAQSLSESDYTADSWNAFNAVWSALMPLSDISGFAEETQTNVYNRLKAAIDGLVPVDNTDTEKSVNEKYKELYAQAQSLSESDYTANSWNAFNAVWSALMPLSDISGFAEATQTNVYNRLKTAIDGLVPSDDNDIEIEDLSSVNWNDKYIELREVALKLDESDYTAESWAAFNNVWSRIGQYVNINGFLETTQIKFFYQLRTAMDNLDVVDGDITSTAQKYIHLYAIANVLKESNYTSDSWNVFNTVWSELSVNKNISKLTADEQDKVYNRLVLAIDQLVPNESYYQEFLDLFDEAENLDNSKYTDDSWKDFSEAVDITRKNWLPSAEKEYQLVGDISDRYLNILKGAFTKLYLKDTSEVVLTDEVTGIKLITNNYDIDSNTILEVKTYDRNNWRHNYEGSVTAAMPTTCSEYVEYQIFTKDINGNLSDVKRKYLLTIPIPEEFDISKLEVSFLQKSGAFYKPGYTIDEDNRILTVDYSNYQDISNSGSVILTNPISAVDPIDLSDGVYHITAQLTNIANASTASMSNATINHDAYLVKNGDDIEVYLEFNPIYPFGETQPSYCGGLWSEKGKKADGDYYEDSETVLAYFTNEDGTIRNNEIYNGVTEFPCVKTIKLKLERDSFNSFGGYTLVVSSPAMAALNSLPYDEVILDELLANLMISEPKYLGSYSLVKDELPGYEKSAVEREIEYAETFDENDYTSESYQNLVNAKEAAKIIYQTQFSDKVTASEAYEEQINLLKQAVKNLVKETSESGDKTALEALVSSAKAITADEYTNSSFAALTEAIAAAESVLAKESVKQIILDEQTAALQAAIDALEKKPETALDKDNLADGKYTLYADMIKTDRVSKSMSDNAINHTVQLEVVDGEYFITMQFKGLAIYNQFGYLKDLGYYDAGYSYNEYGLPQGTVVPATVLSTYDVVDQYNDADNLYPQMLRFKLVDKASEQYVPLQVFVPIMEAIAEGTGTQDVLMQLDWSTLVKTDEDIIPEEPEKQSPAIDVADTATGVKAHADAGVFPEGTKMVVTAVTSGNDYNKTKTALDGTSNKFKAYEIHFVDADGNAVQPNGNVTVSYPIPDDYDSTALSLYRINEDGTKTLIKGEAQDGFYVAVQRSFSACVLADTSVTSLKLSKTSATLEKDASLTLKATVNPTNATNQKLTWSTSNKNVATVDSNGKVKAVGKGTATITVKSANGKKATCKVTVTLPVTSVKLSKTSITLNKSKTAALKATINPTNANNQKLTWSTSNKKVATVDGNGKVKAVGKGTATITVKSANGKTATCKVTVTVPVTSVKLSKTSITLNKSKTVTLKATINPTNASNKKLTWSTSDKKVATVDSNGKVKAVGKGTATITVKSANGKKATCKVTVKIPATKIKLNKTKLTLKVKKTVSLKATVTPANSSDKLTWTSSNKKIATVSSSGKVTAKKAGTVTITVKTASGKKAACKITVKAK